MGPLETPAMRQEADRETECRYCRAKWPFFGAIDGQPLPVHHPPRNPDWHARVTCRAARVVSVDRQGASAHVVEETIRAFPGTA